jgi:hypothetical protein
VFAAASPPTTPGEESEVVLELGAAAESSELTPWSMEINCCKLFTPTIWLMYAFGSVGWVGSWFWSSLTSKVKKSLAVIVEGSLVSAVAVDPVPEVPPVVVAFDLGVVMLLFGANADATVREADESEGGGIVIGDELIASPCDFDLWIC